MYVFLFRILIAAAVDVNTIAKSGGTALMFAAGGGHNDTTKLLLEAGAEVDVRVNATAEYLEQVKTAITEGKEDMDQHQNGVTALSIAALGGHIGTVKLLLDAGANVSAMDEDGLTPLLHAVKHSFFEVAQLILERNGNPDDEYVDEKNVSHNLLMDAIIYNRTEFATTLITKGANLRYVDSEGVTLLTQAAYLGHEHIVTILINHGADVTAANKEG